MKMPASGGDPVSSTLRLAFSPSSKAELDCGIEASAKRVLLSRIEYEPTTNFQASVLNSLKSKYIVINHKAQADGVKTVVHGASGNKKSNNVTLPVPKLTLFPPERVQLGYRGNTNIGSGMANMGNTCYLNSTLQALFHVPALVNWLISETAHQKCEQNSDYQMHPDDITCSVIKTFKCSQQKTGACMKPISVYSKLKAICKHLSHGSQEDAHEFMRYLLESLEKSYLTRFQGHKLDSASKETTPINQIFGGYIRTEVTCLSCNAVSTTFQHFQDLPLDIRKASTLNDALSGYFERERLPEGEDAYKCEKCNRKVPATKKFSIEKPPNVLCVQLKRFSAANGKITKQVQLPENLDVTRFISPSVQPRHPVTYKLVSMVTHMGQSANCGHYTAIALASNNRYYQFDDSSVRQIPTCTVLSMSAYLVLYEIDRPFATVNPRPFSAPAAASWKESPNNGEKADSWSECESVTTSTNSNGIDRDNRREGSESGSRVVNQLKHGKVNTPPVSPTREPPSTNHRHGAVGSRNGDSESKGTGTSLVPYESDASSESDAENKDKSELERLLLTKSSCAKGWQVTEQNDSLTNGSKACTTSWNVTEVKTLKLARNLSDTELNGRKKKKIKTCGSSDSEVDKSSTNLEDKKKKRTGTSILERYKTNFGGSSQEVNKDAVKKIWSESVNRGLEQNQQNSKSKSFQFSRPIAVNGHNGGLNGNNGNGSINTSKNLNKNGDANGNCEDKSGSNFDRATDDDPNEAEEKAFCSSIVREVERKKEIIGTLLQNSHRGYGTSTVKSWNGTQTNLERETEEEKRESTKRTYDSYYNDEFDKGKAKKLKTDDYSKERDRARYNVFQERANQQQQQQQQPSQHHHHHHHYRSMNGGRYPNDFRNHNKRKSFNGGYYNKNNNWNYRRKQKNFSNYKYNNYSNYRH